MKRSISILACVGVVALAGVALWQFRAPRIPKKLDIIVTFVGVTNDAAGNPLVAFRISNPYPRDIWFLPPKRGSTNNLYQGPWQQPWKFLSPQQSDVIHIPPPVRDGGSNQWKVTIRAGLKQDVIQRITDPLIDKVRGASRKYGDDVTSVRMQGLLPRLDGALFSGIVEGDHAAVRKAIADGAPLDFRRGWTMLHLNAMYSGSTNVAQVLLQSGVNVFARNIEGETAIDIAKRNGHPELAGFLETAQRDPAAFLESGQRESDKP